MTRRWVGPAVGALACTAKLTVDVTGHRPPDDTTVAARYVLAVGVTGQGCASACSSK